MTTLPLQTEKQERSNTSHISSSINIEIGNTYFYFYLFYKLTIITLSISLTRREQLALLYRCTLTNSELIYNQILQSQTVHCCYLSTTKTFPTTLQDTYHRCLLIKFFNIHPQKVFQLHYNKLSKLSLSGPTDGNFYIKITFNPMFSNIILSKSYSHIVCSCTIF